MGTNQGTIEDHTLFSQELQEEIPLLIYKPSHYSTLYKYSVLIVQDGKDYFQMGRIGRTADLLYAEGKIENLIIVGIPYRNVNDRRTKYHPDGEKQNAYIRFLAHELVPFIDHHFPTYQVGFGRALGGDSLGATVSMMAALKYPNIFGKMLLQSPYVDEKVLAAIENFDQTHLINIYHVIGKQETEVKMTNGEVMDFLQPNRELHDLIKAKAIQHYYDEFEGNHTWKYWQPDLKRALQKMFPKK
ncbi:alpha/beta hydrolase [Bacillus litorisediminis]|uniref:alpha/beta hydrolase n=1 Tax=Bacillus litorisediminis TaxID=2922713 RepID=UPI001FB03E2E|nr:esterase family protein [Bacillus litorisediminis]